MVISYSKAKLLHLPFLISVGEENRQGIEELLKKDKQKYYYDAADWNRELGMLDAVEFNRQYVAFYHKDSMNQYFKDAEIADSLAVFWNTESPFYMRFKQLDLENVIELACGRGRHVPEYINSAEHITLVDILQKNIDICKQRFESESKIDYYCNNGSDLSELTDNTYTSLFTYDSMVHFEMMDIYKYLLETKRVLKKGGRALFHHSNMHDDYRGNFTNTIDGRNYMSQELFAYLAYRAGLQIIDQQLIDWAKPNEDCITLVEK